MGISAQRKSFCVLQFSKTKSIISVSLAFQRYFGVAAPCAKNIRRWYKQSDKTGCLCKRKTAWQSRTSDEAVLKVQETFSREVHPPCQPRTCHPSVNCKACIKTTFNHATIRIAYGTSPSCWRQNKAWEFSNAIINQDIFTFMIL